jgi:hypothetical protein
MQQFAKRFVKHLSLRLRMTVAPSKYTHVIYKIPVYGESEFADRIREALSILRYRPHFFEFIRQNITILRQGWATAFRSSKKGSPICIDERTWRHSAIWLAGSIAHEAYHYYLHQQHLANNDYLKTSGDWSKRIQIYKNDERKSIQFELAVLTELRADSSIIFYIKDVMEKHINRIGDSIIDNYFLRGLD